MYNTYSLFDIYFKFLLNRWYMKGEYKMSYQEIAKDMIDKLPADKMIYVINILENLGEMYGVSLYPNYEPNKETVEAIEEVDKMIKEAIEKREIMELKIK